MFTADMPFTSTTRPRPCRPHVASAADRQDPTGNVAYGIELIGRWVREARLRAGMSQATLALLSGLHPSTISRLERGVLQGLRLHRLAMIVVVLERSLAPLPI